MSGMLVQLGEVDAAASEGKAPEYGVHLDIASYGDISSFFWAHSQPPPPGLVECNVAYGEGPPPMPAAVPVAQTWYLGLYGACRCTWRCASTQGIGMRSMP